MISSQFRQLILLLLQENGKQILGRPLKEYEILHFMNLHEEKLQAIIQQTKHRLEISINTYLESLR